MHLRGVDAMAINLNLDRPLFHPGAKPRRFQGTFRLHLRQATSTHTAPLDTQGKDGENLNRHWKACCTAVRTDYVIS